MATLIEKANLSEAWLAALATTLEQGGKGTNMLVTIATPTAEIKKVRNQINHLLKQHSHPDVEEVANTIFPEELYLPKLGEKAQAHLYERYLLAWPVLRRQKANQSGTYFHRLIAWPSREGEPINQLEYTIAKLRTPGNFSSTYELGFEDPEVDHGNLAIYAPERDRKRRMGFPCLSHISFTRTNNRLDMSAMYRNQHLVRKAYGNYLGLSRLQHFVCQEAGLEVGELLCVATHADTEFSNFGGKKALKAFIEAAQFSLTARDAVAS